MPRRSAVALLAGEDDLLGEAREGGGGRVDGADRAVHEARGGDDHVLGLHAVHRRRGDVAGHLGDRAGEARASGRGYGCPATSARRRRRGRACRGRARRSRPAGARGGSSSSSRRWRRGRPRGAARRGAWPRAGSGAGGRRRGGRRRRGSRRRGSVARSVVTSTGFSISTCLPASAQARPMSRWVFGRREDRDGVDQGSSRMASRLSTSGKGKRAREGGAARRRSG